MAVVGFDCPYALIVHEDLEMPHSNGQAKFLETAAREVDVGKIASAVYADGGTFREALEAAAEAVLDRAKELVPVDTGELRSSGYVDVVRTD